MQLFSRHYLAVFNISKAGYKLCKGEIIRVRRPKKRRHTAVSQHCYYMTEK